MNHMTAGRCIKPKPSVLSRETFEIGRSCFHISTMSLQRWKVESHGAIVHRSIERDVGRTSFRYILWLSGWRRISRLCWRSPRQCAKVNPDMHRIRDLERSCVVTVFRTEVSLEFFGTDVLGEAGSLWAGSENISSPRSSIRLSAAFRYIYNTYQYQKKRK